MDLFILKNMMKEATCYICQKLMTDSMSIDCGHSYCRLCIVNINESKSVTLSLRKYFCPQCDTPIKSTSLRPNKQLQNIIKVLKEMDLGDLCEEHGDVLHLFCEDDGQFICCYCELLLSRKHQGHTIISIRTCQVYKQKLLETVEKLREMENQCKSMMASIEQQITECVEKIMHQKQKVQSDFKNLKDFLHEEEKSYLWKLEKEKEKVLQKLKDNEASLEKQSQELQNHIQQLEEKCQGSDEILLQDVKDTLKRSSAVQKLKFPEAVSLTHEMLRNISEINFDVNKIANRYQDLYTIKDSNADSTSQEESKAVSSRSGSITGPSSADMASKNSGDFTFNSNDKNSQKPNTGAIVPGTEATSYIGENQEGSNEDSYFEPAVKDKAD